MPSSPVSGRHCRPIHSLVLDTAPLLTTPYGQIKSFDATHYYTVPLAKEEVKDETARAALEIWGSELRIRQPNAKSIQEVIAFSKKTGDYAVLSIADIHVLALTYELECELNHGDWRLLKEPGSKERRGPQPRPRTPSFSTPTTSNIPQIDYDDTRSVITDITTATITPSESASTIFRNTFDSLQSSSPDTSNIPSRSTTPTPRTFATESSISTLPLITTPTAKGTLCPPSTVATESVVSIRTSATEDWSVQSDDEQFEHATPMSASFDLQHSLEDSFANLAVSDEDDGHGIWITPSNIKKQKIRDATTTNSVVSASTGALYSLSPSRRKRDGSERSGAVMKAACLTGDYAMQNVALQMGLNLISSDGSGIQHVKTWALRCHGCFKITKTMDLKFCPSCGGRTLLRTSITTNANGEVKVHLKKNMQWTNRGTKFSLPKPHPMSATPALSTPPPILRADQKEFIHFQRAQKRREKDLMDPDNLPSFLEGKGKHESFGFGGRSAGRIGGGRGRGTNAVRKR